MNYRLLFFLSFTSLIIFSHLSRAAGDDLSDSIEERYEAGVKFLDEKTKEVHSVVANLADSTNGHQARIAVAALLRDKDYAFATANAANKVLDSIRREESSGDESHFRENLFLMNFNEAIMLSDIKLDHATCTIIQLSLSPKLEVDLLNEERRLEKSEGITPEAYTERQRIMYRYVVILANMSVHDQSITSQEIIEKFVEYNKLRSAATQRVMLGTNAEILEKALESLKTGKIPNAIGINEHRINFSDVELVRRLSFYGSNFIEDGFFRIKIESKILLTLGKW